MTYLRKTISKAVVESKKKSKEEVDYSKGMINSRCGICIYYSKGKCEKVKGDISPEMWCKLFKTV